MQPKTCLGLFLGLIVLFLAPAILADQDYTVRLTTAEFTPEKTANASAKSVQLLNKHILIQFENSIDDQTKASLANEGIELLGYIPNNAFTARLTQTLDQSTMDQYGIRWFDKVQPVNKISPLINEMGIADWAKRDNNRAQFVVVLHGDEDLNQWASYFETQFNAEIIGVEPSAHIIDLVMSDQAHYRAADLDAVSWIQMVNPPQKIDNNISRTNTQADIVQAAPYNLDGTGINVAEWDGGHAYQVHSDFTGRVSYADAAADHYHATHVAGTIMGAGTTSGGTYKGMAPNATLVSWLWWGTASEATSEYSTSQIFYGSTVANNSWGLSTGEPAQASLCDNILGNYRSECTTIDNIVRGGVADPMVICWSAGNERSFSQDACGSLGYVYNTIGAYATSKNVITVGAISGSTSNMSSFSSWGPTDDGRLKPDVCGPGVGVTSTNVGGGYLNLSGTSMSSPAVAGCVALMQQQGEISFPGHVFLSSTIKGILINTSTDLGNVGPDFAYGHGKVQVQKAIDKIMDGDSSYIEAEISGGQVHIYDLTVPSWATELKVTLVWDDPGGTILAGPNLVNNLDLLVVDPFTNDEFPWILNPASPSSPATHGVDNLNNVESVTLSNPTPGLWKARVTGTNVPSGPQKYSLVFTPDAINTPGNLAALAVYDSPDVEIDPGLPTTVEFYVSNVGANADSIQIDIFDNLGWMTSPVVNTTVFLNPYDSAFFSVDVTVPASALDLDEDSVICQMTSLTDANVTTFGATIVGASAFYAVNIVEPNQETVNSPDTIEFDVTFTNNGNAIDNIKLTPNDQFGWSLTPAFKWTMVEPGADSTVTFTATIPPEEVHLSINEITIDAFSLNGSIDTSTFNMTVNNPFAPPSLVLPEPDFFTQENYLTFSWAGAADSFNLYIASDTNITIIERTYTGITANSFDMPAADSLFEGGHYWAVRLYTGTDSSSLQRNTRRVVVDTEAPNIAIPTSPINGAYVGNVQFLFFFQDGGSGVEAIDEAPEFNRIEIADDENFTVNTRLYEPIISTLSFTMQDSLGLGRFYWRIQRADSAGNTSTWSAPESFIIDLESPPIVTPTVPANGGTGGGANVLFSWLTDAPPPYEEASEFYYLQIGTSSSFSTTIFGQDVFTTTPAVAADIFSEAQFYYWRVRAKDSVGHSSGNSPIQVFQFVGLVCGDVNNNGAVNISDLTYLVSFLFGIPSGPAPDPFNAGWVNCDQSINISDVTYLVSFLFGVPTGPSPCCGQGAPPTPSNDPPLLLVPETKQSDQTIQTTTPSTSIEKPSTTVDSNAKPVTESKDDSRVPNKKKSGKKPID